MDLLTIIERKNDLHILLIKSMDKLKKYPKKEALIKNVEILKNSLELINLMHDNLDHLRQKNSKLEIDKTLAYIEIANLKKDLVLIKRKEEF